MTLFQAFHWRLRSFLASLTANSMLSAPLTQRLTVVLLTLVLVLPPPRVQGFGVCRNSFRCLNGGVERYGTSIFSPCRCRCLQGYTGPRCQYREVVRKRSDDMNLVNDFLQDTLWQEQQQQQQQQEQQQQLLLLQQLGGGESLYDNNDDVDDDYANDDEGDDYYNSGYDFDRFFSLKSQRRNNRRRLHPKFFRR